MGREELHCLTPQPVAGWAREDGKPVCPALASQEGSEMPFLVVEPTHSTGAPGTAWAEGTALCSGFAPFLPSCQGLQVDSLPSLFQSLQQLVHDCSRFFWDFPELAP